MELRINHALYEVTELEKLKAHLAGARGSQFTEVWMQQRDSWPSICALINGEAAWLMFLRFEGDSGLSTRNPDYSGPPKAVIEYYLSNGQRDEYPASWNITTSEALRALEYFFGNEKMAPWLRWHEEGP
jgi:hypothetical protein